MGSIPPLPSFLLFVVFEDGQSFAGVFLINASLDFCPALFFLISMIKFDGGFLFGGF